MKIGVIELLTGEMNGSWYQKVYSYMVRKQYASIMPQVVSVWCRELGHEVFYATYFGQKDPKRLLPNSLDVVFISTFTQASALAYALAKLYREEKTLTVLGGPHAKQFPKDSLRFFDIVVQECDKNLIEDVLNSAPRGHVVTSGHSLRDIPTVQERLPEIQVSNFWRGRPHPFATIPMVASTGCPYKCDFCVDWSNPYALLPLDKLETDLRFILKNFPNMLVSFHDPNFAVKFDDIVDILEKLPHKKRNWYMIQSSLSILSMPRLERLHGSGCYCVIPGIESWTGYTNKSSGLYCQSTACSRQKLDNVVEHFKIIHDYIPIILANYIFGLDGDEGNEPVELTKEFVDNVPFVSLNINIPTPFGGTPLYDQYLKTDRILTSMPLSFYYTPYLVTTVKNYDPVTYYEKLIEMYLHMTSMSMFLKRLKGTSGVDRFPYNPLRTINMKNIIKIFRRILNLMTKDRQFRAFHEGESQSLPEYYQHMYEHSLGPYASLLSLEDRQPILS